MSGRMMAEVTTSTTKSVLYKPLHDLTEDDISQLTREDCRRFLKEKGMRRPSWNKSQAIQQVISLKSLLEPSPPPNAAAKLSFRPLPITSSSTNNNNANVNSNSSRTFKELGPVDMERSVTALVEDGCLNQPRKLLGLDVASDGEYHVNDTHHNRDRCNDAPNLQSDQMSIFNRGKVNVYDGVPIDKQAGSILHLASSPNQFCEDEPSNENPPNLNTQCHVPGSSVDLNLSNPDVPSLQAMQPDVESQTNRQVSLLRYFEKRKDRGKFKMKRKTGTSSPGLEMYFSTQMNAPVRHNSESNASSTNYLGVPRTGYETKEKHT